MILFKTLLFLAATIGIATAQPSKGKQGTWVADEFGAIIRGDVNTKALAIVFTGDEFADGGDHIVETLRNQKIKASFFLTGKFYSNPRFAQLIRQLKKDGHYLGAHSDQHLLYADWTKRDSLLVTKNEFQDDLLKNYERMRAFGIQRKDALYFMPPYEWYNATIAEWTEQLGFKLVNFTPGTRSAADYTYPEMGARYISSDAIYQSIVRCERREKNGLNGFILLVHIGTDPRRTDKFYHRLGDLILDLKRRGYSFCTVDELLDGDGSEK